MVSLQQQTKSAPGCSNEENRAIEAYSDLTKIGTAPDAEIKKHLALVFPLVGLTGYPDKLAEVVLINFMRSNYSMFSLKEMDLAFEMAVAGKLSVDVDHYQQFSPAYFSRIMNAYKVWVTEIRKQYDKPKPFERKVSVTENQWRETIQKTYENYNEKTNWRLWPVEFYDQLQMDGFIQLRWHEKYLKEAKNKIAAEIHLQIAQEKDEIKQIGFERELAKLRAGNREFEVILLAKQMSVKELFEFGKTLSHRGFYEQEN